MKVRQPLAASGQAQQPFCQRVDHVSSDPEAHLGRSAHFVEHAMQPWPADPRDQELRRRVAWRRVVVRVCDDRLSAVHRAGLISQPDDFTIAVLHIDDELLECRRVHPAFRFFRVLDGRSNGIGEIHDDAVGRQRQLEQKIGRRDCADGEPRVPLRQDPVLESRIVRLDDLNVLRCRHTQIVERDDVRREGSSCHVHLDVGYA
jgi:hypothetical protein